MGTGGCALNGLNTAGTVQNGRLQRYGQYAAQFVDANANADADPEPGDEDGNGAVLGDNDDEDLGIGPAAFPAGTPLTELYLIKTATAVPERLALRRTVVRDPNAPATASCDLANGTGSGCLGRLEMLRLVGRDYGMAHTGSVATPSPGRFDGAIDTWECRGDFRCFGPENTPTGSGAEWISVFPDEINVASLAFFPFPNKDYRLAWKESDPLIRTAPYVRIELSVGFSWKRRKKVDLGDSRTSVTTTVSLSQ